MAPHFLIWMAAVAVTQARAGPQCEEPQHRVDCGSIHTHQQDCEAQGCCWRPVNPNPANLPWCFKPENASLSCFNLLSKPLSSAPFDDAAVQKMMNNFVANIDVNVTGAVVASPGAVPALKGCCPGVCFICH